MQCVLGTMHSLSTAPDGRELCKRIAHEKCVRRAGAPSLTFLWLLVCVCGAHSNRIFSHQGCLRVPGAYKSLPRAVCYCYKRNRRKKIFEVNLGALLPHYINICCCCCQYRCWRSRRTASAAASKRSTWWSGGNPCSTMYAACGVKPCGQIHCLLW